MQSLNVPILLCFFAIAYGFPEPQIVGGKDAPSGMFPYQVSLRNSGRHFCGGSIISSRYVLTAAHCVEGLYDTSKVTIHAGTNLLNSLGETYGVDKIASHSGFDSGLLINDVAMIRVNKEIAFNDLVQPIPLASGSNTFEGSECTLSGWGRLQAGGAIPNNLQYINLLIQGEAKCRQSHWNVRSSHICTFTKYGEGACNGDSGSPLVVNGVQVGIVSFGMPCGVGYPDVYTRVSSFTAWIKDQHAYLQKDEIAAQPEDIIYA